MKHTLFATAAILAIAFSGSQAFTQTPQTLVELDGAPVAAPRGAVDPAAVSALDAMTRYLGTLQAFEATTTSSLDEVLDSGQKIQLDGGGVYKVKRPNAFFIEVRSDRRQRQFFYNGAEFTMYAPRMSLYTQVAAPDTIREVVQAMEDNYEITFPLADLFYWGDTPEDVKTLTSAMRVGYAKIKGVDCDQYAFRQDRVDWQVWIQRGAQPLPRKLVITTRTDPAMPQFTAFIDWNTTPQFDASTFDFKPPAGAYRAEILRVSQ